MVNVETFSEQEQTVILAHHLCEETCQQPDNSVAESEEIARVAYTMYEAEGGQPGREAEHWARAERVVHEQRLLVPSP